jgi:hypothetical protein
MGKLLVIKNADFSANRVDKVVPIIDYDNLVNPATLTNGKYINSSGGLTKADPDYSVSDYIEVKAQNISAAGLCPWDLDSFPVYGIAVYDSSKKLLRVIREDGLRHYTYKEGDAYIRMGLCATVINDPTFRYYISGYPAFFACYGDRLLPYKEYGT